MRATIVLVYVLSKLCAARHLGLVYENDYVKTQTDTFTQLVLRDFQIEHSISTISALQLNRRTRKSSNSTILILSHSDHTSPSIDNILKLLQCQKSSVWILLKNKGPCQKYSALQPKMVSLEALTVRSRTYLSYDRPKLTVAHIVKETKRNKNCDGTKHLEKQHLRVGSMNLKPLSYLEKTGNKSVWRGVEIDLFKTVARSLNLTYEFFEPLEHNFNLDSPNYNLAAMMRDKVVDIAVTSFVYSNERTRLFDPIGFDYYGSWVIVVPPPRVEYYLLSNIKPFQASVWGAIAASLVVMSVLMWAWAKQLNMGNEFSLGILYNISLIAGQGGFSTRNLHGRFLLAGWNLGITVIVFGYTSIMVSFMTAPTANFPVKSLKDFVSKDALKPISNRNVFLTMQVLQAKSGYEKELGDKLRKCASCLPANDDDAAVMVLKGGYGFIAGQPVAETQLIRDFRSTGKCRLAMRFPEDPLSLNTGWFMSKDLKSMTEAFRTKITMAFETGITRYVYRQYLRDIPCYLTANLLPNNEATPLTTIQLQTAFALLGLGWLLAITMFATELMKKRNRVL